ncbi:MAG: hypothetical protein F9K22_11720 [Bacteroidetes bacterium]|nr:MAG: hypothetical protein F9K22_11720 [Bacteroidota bacterium]
MKAAVLLLSLLIVPSASAQKKKGPLFIPSDQVYSAARTLAGDSASWPVVVALAERDAERNGFLLPAAAQPRLAELAKMHADMRLGRRFFANLLKAGARVFAPERMNAAAALSAEFDRQVRDGSLDGALRAGARFLTAVDDVAKEVEEERREDVDALVAKRQGEVSKRKGLLGRWDEARLGDLLKRSDGVRTGEASFAQLSFTDGVDVMVDPNSTLLIRESTMDRLDRSIRRDIALVRGGLLATLTAGAKERNDLRLQAGSSRSEVRSGKFWASAVEERRVRLSNYDGTMKVSATGAAVQLGANEGTVVEQGRPPMTPVRLLPPPELLWPRIDSTVYTPELPLAWRPVPGAKGYRVELSAAKDFTADPHTAAVSAPAYRLQNLKLGLLYARVTAVDALGLRGMESPVYTIVRVEDKLPPAIHVNGWETDRKYTILPAVTIGGTTEPDAQFSADGRAVPVAPDGSFTLTVPVGRSERQVRLRAADRSGNARERLLSVMPMDTAVVMAVEWNAPLDEGVLRPATVEIAGRGRSYPSVRITAVHGDQTAEARTDAQGHWALSLRRIAGLSLTLTFESLTDNAVIGTRTLQVE